MARIECPRCDAVMYTFDESKLEKIFGDEPYEMHGSYLIHCKACNRAIDRMATKIAKAIKSRRSRGLPDHIRCDCAKCAGWRLANGDKIQY